MHTCDDTRGCIKQFWTPDDEHMCSKYVEVWNKTYCERNILCIKLVNYWDKYTEMHGQQNVKICDAMVHEKATYRCDDTRGCVMQFWPPDDEHMCSKHVEALNKLIVKEIFCASSWLITEINILRCTVSKTSKFVTQWCTRRPPIGVMIPEAV